jgi:hypothetical protein
MINARNNSAQGGLMADFFDSQRVLDGDPFRVLVLWAEIPIWLLG